MGDTDFITLVDILFNFYLGKIILTCITDSKLTPPHVYPLPQPAYTSNNSGNKPDLYYQTDDEGN